MENCFDLSRPNKTPSHKKAKLPTSKLNANNIFNSLSIIKERELFVIKRTIFSINKKDVMKRKIEIFKVKPFRYLLSSECL